MSELHDVAEAVRDREIADRVPRLNAQSLTLRFRGDGKVIDITLSGGVLRRLGWLTLTRDRGLFDVPLWSATDQAGAEEAATRDIQLIESPLGEVVVRVVTQTSDLEIKSGGRACLPYLYLDAARAWAPDHMFAGGIDHHLHGRPVREAYWPFDVEVGRSHDVSPARGSASLTDSCSADEVSA